MIFNLFPRPARLSCLCELPDSVSVHPRCNDRQLMPLFSIYLDFHALRLRHITPFTFGKFHFGSIQFADRCRP